MESSLLFTCVDTIFVFLKLSLILPCLKRAISLGQECGNLIQTSTISEYDLWREGDLFKAPEPIIEEPAVGLDPMIAAISMISCGEDVITPQTIKVADSKSIQIEQLMSEVFYECKKDILAKEAFESALFDIMDKKIPVGIEENLISDGKFLTEESFQKGISSECLSSMDWMHGAPMRPNFLDFPGMDLDAVYGMRKAFSEGDIKDGAGSLILSFYDRLLYIARISKHSAIDSSHGNKAFLDGSDLNGRHVKHLQ
ncbi:hypothetical protein RHMOL_Rhmol01G0178700 [Rhododendron molle]|uniref:Uncharacterized protein n=1 Tax=Rhododendron molle TaxID=49168 RepID=A0ACC0Q5N7_RHOML|nr:hypothetical protein RHMOL_Rhmol01G0178700 [Rhododendron molle]